MPAPDASAKKSPGEERNVADADSVWPDTWMTTTPDCASTGTCTLICCKPPKFATAKMGAGLPPMVTVMPASDIGSGSLSAGVTPAGALSPVQKIAAIEPGGGKPGAKFAA